jgi:hypothetical protein
MDMGSEVVPIEIKSGQTMNDEFLKGLNYYRKLNPTVKQSWLIYGGDKYYQDERHKICPYDQMVRKIVDI